MAVILVVDDRPTNRELLVTLLGYRGHRVLEAGDGSEGLAVARRERPDLVISDIVMPAMDGYEFVRHLRADPDVGRTRVVFYTATYLEAEARALAARCGVAHLITKPCDPEVILRTVDEALASAPPTPPAVPAPTDDFDREHVRLVTDKLKSTADEVSALNERLSQLIILTQRLASERDPRRLLESLCHAAREIIAARLAVVGIGGANGHSMRDLIVSGMSAGDAARLIVPAPGTGVMASLFAGRPVIRQAERIDDPAGLGLPQGWPPITSLLAVPIVSPTKVYGWLCLTEKLRGEAFTADDEHLAIVLAAHAGRIYENGGLYKELSDRALELQGEIEERRRAEETLRHHTRRLEALRELDQAILTADSTEMLAAAVVHQARRIIPCDRASVVLTDVDTGYDTILATESDRPTRVATGSVLAPSPGRDALIVALRQRGFYILDDIAEGDVPAPIAALAADGLRSVIGVALRVRGELIGLLALSSDRRGAFTEEHVALAKEIAAPLAIGIEQARLDDRVRQHASELEARVVERTAQLKLVNDELESFSYSVSHDLQAPLRQMRGFAKILMEDHAAQLDTDGQRCVQRLDAAGQRMEELIADIISLARVTRGDLRKQPVDLSRLAEEILARLRQSHPTRTVETIVAPGLTAQGDPHLLRLALENLLANAWKYTGHHPQARIEFGAFEQAGEAVYFVRDDGAGFDPAAAARLFGVFQRLHDTSQFEGTGIGLATVRRVIRRHGGRIWAEAAIERGATFYFTLNGTPA